MSVYLLFFKQKTAYEMRISDWSSDGCSSDLYRRQQGHFERESELPVRLGICRPVPEADRLRHGGGRAGEGKMMSVYVFGSAAAGTAFLSRVHCHLGRCMGAGLLAIAVLLVAEPARAHQTILASDRDRKSTRLNSRH